MGAWSGAVAARSGLILTHTEVAVRNIDSIEGSSGCDTDAGIIPTPAVHQLSKGSGKIAVEGRLNSEIY